MRTSATQEILNSLLNSTQETTVGKFQVGEVVIAVKPAGIDDKLGMHGHEVTIIAPLRRRHMAHYGVQWCYLTDWPGHSEYKLRALPEWLRRKEQKIPWSDCVFQPATADIEQ